MGWTSFSIRLAWLCVLWVALFGCRRSQPVDGTPLYAAFNQRKPLAVLVGSVAEGRYQVVARSLMSGRLAIQLRNVGLRATSGLLEAVPDEVSCVLGGGERVILLSGLAERHDPASTYVVEADLEATPLDQPGRAMYREWAWLRRPTEIEQIDAELAALDALVLCRSLRVGSPRPAQ